MSNIIVEFNNNNFNIIKNKARQTENDFENININDLVYNKFYKSKIKITNILGKDKIYLLKIINSKSIIKEKNELEEEAENNQIKETRNAVLIFSNGKHICYIYGDIEKIYRLLIKIKYKILKIKLNKKGITIYMLAYIINKYNLNISKKKLCLTDTLQKDIKLNCFSDKINNVYKILKNKIIKYQFNMKDIIEDKSKINNILNIKLEIDNNEIQYNIGIKNKKIKVKRFYYIPIKTKFINQIALNIRRTSKGHIVILKRFKEDIEKTFKYKIFENKILSLLLYVFGEIKKRISKKQINLFFEKFSSKSEEGVFELCELSQNSKKSKNYFIIDKNSEDFKKIKNKKFVISKYSFKYYRILYQAKNMITSEAPLHINILRANNIYLRKSIYKKKFIFLQHGITYLKCQGQNSSFIKGREAEPDYIIVGSQKEKDVIVDELKLDEEKILNTGLAIFDKIKYNHINNASEDNITIMLTWKPYEEYLYNFEESTYYQNTLKLYKICLKHINKDKIIILPHPKVVELLMQTDLKNNIYKGPISEALEKTKLLITDYSSICYNSFYQGAGVIFYQEDLELYEEENGPLIPNNDEYIGYRSFNDKELENYLSLGIKDSKIDLNYFRKKEFVNNYKTINEFSDGKNIERIYNELKKINIV